MPLKWICQLDRESSKESQTRLFFYCADEEAFDLIDFPYYRRVLGEDFERSRGGMRYRSSWFPSGEAKASAILNGIVPALRRKVRGERLPSVTEISKRTRSPFKVLVSTVISARTKDEVTKDASERLFARADTPIALATMSEKEIAGLIYPAGFYRTKARNLKRLARILVDDFGGEVPRKIEELTSLPGVGRKTANLVLTLAFGDYGICVDTHVHRIVNRIGVIKTQTPEQTEYALRRVLSKKHWIEFNDLLVTFGKKVCTPVSPFCSVCPIERDCLKVNVKRKR